MIQTCDVCWYLNVWPADELRCLASIVVMVSLSRIRVVCSGHSAEGLSYSARALAYHRLDSVAGFYRFTAEYA